MTEQVETANPATEEAKAPTFEAGSEDEAVQALLKRNTEAETDPEAPTDEPQGDATDEPDSGEPEEADEPAEALAEVEYEGKTYKVAPELEKALLRQADYSRKMGVVSEKEKVADRLIESAEKQAQALAELHMLDAEIKKFEAVDFDKLEQEDPARASILALRLMRLQSAREKAANGSEAIKAEIDKAKAEAIQVGKKAMLKTLAESLPGWGDELGVKITQHFLKSGFAVEEVQAITDPRIVIAMDKARKFDAIQDGKKAIQGKAKEAPPVAKPGAKRVPPSGAEAAMAQLRKTNSTEDAERAFLARMR